MSIDETYLHDWFEWGITELEWYLECHARFDLYLRISGRL